MGLPKTGTTFLQKKVFPKLNFINSVHNERLLFNMIYQDSVDYQEEEFEGEEGILSLEGLTGIQPVHEYIDRGKVADRLWSKFPDAKILIVVRNQFDMMRSLYSHCVRVGCTVPFRKFVLYNNGFHETRDPKLFGYTYITYIPPQVLDYTNLLKYYEKFDLTVLQFEELQKNPELFIKKVCDWAEEDTITIDMTKENESTGNVSITRFLNRFVRSRYNNAPLFPWLDSRKVYNKFKCALPEDKEVEAATREYYSESNRILNDRFNLSLAV